MKKILALAAAILLSISGIMCHADGYSGPAYFLVAGPSLPLTCSQGQVFTLVSGTTYTPEYCSSPNTWMVFGGGSSGTVTSGSNYAIPTYGSAAGTVVGPGDFANNAGTNLMQSPTATQNLTYAGGQDGTNTGSLGAGILRGANQTATTATGYSGSVAGGALISGGSQASTATGAQSGSVEIGPGQNTGGGVQGVTIIEQEYNQGSGTHTQWSLQCADATTAQTADDCGATPPAILGVEDAHTGSVIEVHVRPSITPVLASAAVTLGDTVCAGATAGKVTDSGGTGPCGVGAGFTVGWGQLRSTLSWEPLRETRSPGNSSCIN